MDFTNRKTAITTSVIGVLLGLGGILNHGLFEILQGSTPTPGHYIEAIGPQHRFWLHGTEGAFTVIPNFLLTGMCVIVISLAAIVWSVGYIQTKHGASVFLGLFVLLTLVGGGIGHILIFLPTWAWATRTNKALTRWEKLLPVKRRTTLSGLWPYVLTATVVSWLLVMELGIFGYVPGLENPDTILNIVFALLFFTLILLNVTYMCALARDLKERQWE
jgi:hypothetical protein